MSSTTHITKRLGAVLAAVAAVAALAVPPVLAAGYVLPAGFQTDTVNSAIAAHNAQSVAPNTLRAAGDVDGYYRLDPWLRTAIAAHRGQAGATYSLPTGFVTDTVSSAGATPSVVTVQASGFDWGSFGIGIGTGVGALLILVAVASRVGKVRQLVSA